MRETLRMVFTSTKGKKITMSIPHADTTADPANIGVLVNTIIENNRMYHEDFQPAEFVGAEYVITQVQSIDVPTT